MGRTLGLLDTSKLTQFSLWLFAVSQNKLRSHLLGITWKHHCPSPRPLEVFAKRHSRYITSKEHTLYTVPKAPDPRTLTRFNSVSFKIRSCAWLGAVPLGVKGSTSCKAKRVFRTYLMKKQLEIWWWVVCKPPKQSWRYLWAQTCFFYCQVCHTGHCYLKVFVSFFTVWMIQWKFSQILNQNNFNGRG